MYEGKLLSTCGCYLQCHYKMMSKTTWFEMPVCFQHPELNQSITPTCNHLKICTLRINYSVPFNVFCMSGLYTTSLSNIYSKTVMQPTLGPLTWPIVQIFHACYDPKDKNLNLLTIFHNYLLWYGKLSILPSSTLLHSWLLLLSCSD
jgi:hypothetical protein